MPFALILYNLVLLINLVVLWPVWLVWLLVSRKARNGLRQKLGGYSAELLAQMTAVSKSPKKKVWFHAVSVGEFNAIRPLIDDLKNACEVIITTTTKTSQDLAKKTYPELCIFYYPFDLRRVIQAALQRLNPDLVILTETELWPNFIDMVSRRWKTPIILINGRISKSSYKGYGMIKSLMETILNELTHCYMQSQGDADRLISLGDMSVEQVTVVGNLKFEINPVVDPIQRNILSHLLSFSDQDTILTYASTHAGEDGPLLEVYHRLKKDFPELKLILAPRHPERREELKTILHSKALRFSLRSQLSEAHPNDQPIVVLDTIGDLLSAYSLSHLAVMGGSFIERGGQNPLEPLSQRIPVLFGPDMSNFTEISRMILEQNAGYQAKDYDELVHEITELLTQPERYDSIVENGQLLLDNNRGTKEILLIGIRKILMPGG